MKTANSLSEQSSHKVIENSMPSIAASDVCQIIDKATQEGVSNRHEILQLAKLILKLDPQEVDADMQAKFDQLMGKVRAQFS